MSKRAETPLEWKRRKAQSMETLTPPLLICLCLRALGKRIACDPSANSSSPAHSRTPPSRRCLTDPDERIKSLSGSARGHDGRANLALSGPTNTRRSAKGCWRTKNNSQRRKGIMEPPRRASGGGLVRLSGASPTGSVTGISPTIEGLTLAAAGWSVACTDTTSRIARITSRRHRRIELPSTEHTLTR